MKRSLLLLLLIHLSTQLFAADLSYPKDKKLTALEIAQQVFLVLRVKLPNNASSKKHKGEMSLLINRRQGRKASVNQFENYINNNYSEGAITQKQLAIFRTGKLKGTGILITHYIDTKHKPLMQMWLPKLRKVRRFAAPQANDFWNGSNLTYGEVFLRTVDDEEHSLLPTTIFSHCLKTLTLPIKEQSKHTKNLPKPQCSHQGKAVYQLKSRSRLANNWYEHHISFIDKSSFAVYRTQYYKNNDLIKTVDIDWQSLHLDDPRAVFPAYLYSKSHTNQSESLFIVPKNTVLWNSDIKQSFWSESSLRKIKR